MKPTREFSTQPLVAMTMIATVALALASGSVVAPAAIVVVLAVYSFTGWPRASRPRTYHALVLSVPFALWWREYSEDSASNEQVPIGLLFIIGLYMCALGVRHLLAHRRGGNLDYTLACAIMGLALAGTAKNDAGQARWFLPMLAVFVVLLLIHLRAVTVGGLSRTTAFGTSVRHAAALGVLILMTAVFEVQVVQRLPALNEWAIAAIVNAGSPPSAGFNRSAQIGSVAAVWNRTQDNVVVMRVFAERSPEYLRGAAFDYYELGRWSLIDEDRSLGPEGKHWNRNVFDALRTGGDAAAPPLGGMVYPEDEFAESFFMPPGVHRVSSYVERARFGRAFTMRPEEGDPIGGYGYFEAVHEHPAPSDRDLHVPFRLRWRIMRLADDIMPDADPRKKIDAMVRHFQSRYTYDLGREVPAGEDPVVSFLSSPGIGHCEFFASSAVLLLRSQGIAARYVTGFVCRERGDGDDLWIIRRKDAHAWVEAYLPGEGWFVVEPTPPSAMPPAEQASGWEATRQWWASQWKRVTRMLRYGGFTAAAGAALDFIASIPGRLPVWAWALIIGGGAVWTFRHDLMAVLARRRGTDAPPQVIALQKKLAEAERLLSRHGLTRPPAQSVRDFLVRLDEAAALPASVRDRARRLLSDYQHGRFRRHP